MKGFFQLTRRQVVPLFCGGILALIASEVFPVLSIGFLRVTYASECAIGFVGPIGSPATESLLAGRLAASPTASLSFRLMYWVGNAQGKAYAVMGLHEVDWEAYKHFRDDFALRPGTVTVHSGCLISDETCESAALFIEELHYPEESRAAAIERLRAHFKDIKQRKATQANQALQHNDPSCHVSCLRTPRASRGRG
jgi:hypothetical protein